MSGDGHTGADDADASSANRFSNEAVLEFSYDDSEAAALVATSLRQDVDRIDGDRSTAAVGREGDTVRVTVRAADLTALRAGLNTWTSLVVVADRTRAAAHG
ncbi:MAG: KEOPS complex subunit Pcc1 [Haloglomus sp.]